ncbi:MAG: glycosyltransferase family 2 protein [bacterium]
MIPAVSIIIPATNEHATLERSLPLILAQDYPDPFDILIIDSGSTDGSREWLTQLATEEPRLHLYLQKPGDFHHAGTRNLGLAITKSERVVFMAGDAMPVDVKWLANLIRPMQEDARIAGTYGRQLPREDADIFNRLRTLYNYPETGVVKTLHDPPMTAKERFFFSSVNCCLHRKRMGEARFDEGVPVNEDVALSWQLLYSGWKIAYVPEAAVVHSHNRSPVEILRRYYDNAVTYKHIGIHQSGDRTLAHDAGGFGHFVLRAMRGKSAKEWQEVGTAMLFGAFGLALGRLHPILPRFIGRRISIYGVE